MNLVSLDQVSLEFGDQPLLTNADFTIDTGERVCLIGRNGVGKSSMMKLISGELHPDQGEIKKKPDIRISRLEQNLPQQSHLTVLELVAQGLESQKSLIDRYTHLSNNTKTQQEARELEKLENRILAGGGWYINQRVNSVISELNLPADKTLGELSGGWQRRVGLAKALVSEPDLLLLDEPTNHLDLSSIRWLEDRVYNTSTSVLFVTHDRAFLQRLASRIVEIDRGKLTSWPGNYHKYLGLKEQALSEEKKNNREFDKKLSQEEAWIRQGLKARRTRNEGRVRALKAMRVERAKRLNPQTKVRIHVEQAEQSGRKVIEARNIIFRFKDEPLIEKLSIKIMRGDRIGLIGNNGVGKSTLLKILLGEITPQSGVLKIGTGLEPGYFDQLRRNLDPQKTVAETVGDGRDYIKVNGKDRHVIGYLRGFLFSPKRAMSPVKSLSGGEINRLLLAKLFTRPTNLLVLDEPTNDLDVETLEVLEDRLCDYQGTLIVVSHDREFLDNVVTSVLVFEPGGQIKEYIGGYSDWERRGKSLAEKDNPNESSKQKKAEQSDRPASKPTTKLSYKLQLELQRLPDTIDQLEDEIRLLQEKTNDPSFYAQQFESRQPILEQLKQKQVSLAQLMARWMELESMQQNPNKQTQPSSGP